MKKMLLVVGFMMFIYYLYSDFNWFEHFSSNQQLTLLILAIAIYLWTASPLPVGASSILILALMIGLGVTEDVEQAFRGFLSSALYFIVLLSLISQVLVKVGFDQVVARLFQKISGGRVRQLMLGLPLLLLVLPIFLPSAMARYKILYPLISKINDLSYFGHQSLFKKFGLYVISFFNQQATIIIFTGGGFSVIAYQLMVEYRVAQLSWMDWFTLMVVPLWTAMVLAVIVIFIYLKWHHSSDEADDGKPNHAGLSKQGVEITINFGQWLLPLDSWY